jgi:hypothetical protein
MAISLPCVQHPFKEDLAPNFLGLDKYLPWSNCPCIADVFFIIALECIGVAWDSYEFLHTVVIVVLALPALFE